MRDKLYTILLGLNNTCKHIGKMQQSRVPIINTCKNQSMEEIVDEIGKVEKYLRKPEYWYLISIEKN